MDDSNSNNTCNVSLSSGIRVGVICLGYVGLPLLSLFSRQYRSRGLDASPERIEKLRQWCGNGNDSISGMPDLVNIGSEDISTEWNSIADCNFYIVAAPTPVDRQNIPDLSALKDVCHNLGHILSEGDTVVFESTVAPGTTEELCIPILELESRMSVGRDFNVGFSPERINVGDPLHSLENVPKIISASTTAGLEMIRSVYGKVVKAGLVCAGSIKSAEAAKIYENVQRDMLIALANQFSAYCHAEGIDIRDVTDCAATKWNFSKVYPGLVGGHCIGVDPYYFIRRCKEKGVDVSFVEHGREINESVVESVSRKIADIYNHCRECKGDGILILGFSYKPDCDDVRNTKVASVIERLHREGFKVDCLDPVADRDAALREYGIFLLDNPSIAEDYKLVVELVAHSCFRYLRKDLSLRELL